MHLDCVFSIVSDNVCIMLEEMMGENSPTRRLVDEYTKVRSVGWYSLGRLVQRGSPEGQPAAGAAAVPRNGWHTS